MDRRQTLTAIIDALRERRHLIDEQIKGYVHQLNNLDDDSATAVEIPAVRAFPIMRRVYVTSSEVRDRRAKVFQAIGNCATAVAIGKDTGLDGKTTWNDLRWLESNSYANYQLKVWRPTDRGRAWLESVRPITA